MFPLKDARCNGVNWSYYVLELIHYVKSRLEIFYIFFTKWISVSTFPGTHLRTAWWRRVKPFSSYIFISSNGQFLMWTSSISFSLVSNSERYKAQSKLWLGFRSELFSPLIYRYLLKKNKKQLTLPEPYSSLWWRYSQTVRFDHSSVTLFLSSLKEKLKRNFDFPADLFFGLMTGWNQATYSQSLTIFSGSTQLSLMLSFHWCFHCLSHFYLSICFLPLPRRRNCWCLLS